MTNNNNVTVTMANLTTLSRKDLALLLQEQMLKNGELSSDIQQIVALLSRFMAENPIPSKITVFWVIGRAGAIMNLIKGIITILKTKGYVQV